MLYLNTMNLSYYLVILQLYIQRLFSFMKGCFKKYILIGLATWYSLASFSLEKASDGYYLINNVDDLIEYRDDVNGGKAMNGRLTANIDLASVCGVKKGNWTPINTRALAIKFDGDNYTISNLYIDTQADEQALFHCADIISNLIVKNAHIRGGEYVAGIVALGSGSDGKIHLNNCHFNGVVIGTQYVGGLCGGKGMVSGTVTNSSNSGLIVGHDYVGGLIGYGIECKIHSCYNIGRVKAYYVYQEPRFLHEGIAGGIVGYYGGSSLLNCFNYGKISGLAAKNLVGERSGDIYNLFKSCYVLENMGKTESYESEVSILSAKEFTDGTLLNSLNDYYENRHTTTQNVFEETVTIKSWIQEEGDEYPHFSHIKQTANQDFVVYYRGDYNGLDVYSSSLQLPTCESSVFYYEFSNGYNGKNAAGDTTVTVTKRLKENFLPKDNQGYYMISSAGDLALFRDAVNGGAVQLKGRLKNNINLSSIGNWEPIGGSDISGIVPFEGIFDGNGYVIKGLHVENDGYGALFSCVQNAKLINITLQEASIEAYYAGTICAVAQSSLILNCGSNGTVKGRFPEGVASFIAVSRHNTILNCYSLGKVSCEGRASGFTGVQEESTIRNCYAACQVTNLSEENGLQTPFAFEEMNKNIIDCYYDTTLFAQGNAFDAIINSNPYVKAQTTNEIQSKTFLEQLNANVESINKEQDSISLTKWVFDDPTRYPIIANKERTAVENDPSQPKELTVYTVEDKLYILAEKNGTVYLYNPLGQAMTRLSYQKGLNEYSMLPKGICIVGKQRVIIK